MSDQDLVADLHSRIDTDVARLTEIHSERLQCRRGCAHCCIDDITVFAVEADLIRSKHRKLLKSGEPHPAGACAFLDGQGVCRIYPDRPYVCRTQGLPLRWIEDDYDEPVEYRDICPLNEEGPPIEDLDVLECWTLGPFEEELAEIESRRLAPTRVGLRDLFKKAAPN